MKAVKWRTVFLISLLNLFTLPTYSQCKRFSKKIDYTVMDHYDHCNKSKVGLMHSGDQVNFHQRVEVGKNYRITTQASKNLGKIEVIILNGRGEVIGVESRKEQHAYWDLTPEKDQVVYIQLKTQKEESTIDITTSGCLALIIGEKESTQLVSIP